MFQSRNTQRDVKKRVLTGLLQTTENKEFKRKRPSPKTEKQPKALSIAQIFLEKIRQIPIICPLNHAYLQPKQTSFDGLPDSIS